MNKSQPFHTYHNISPLDKSGCVVLVQNEDSGEFFVKKTVSSRKCDVLSGE